MLDGLCMVQGMLIFGVGLFITFCYWSCMPYKRGNTPKRVVCLHWCINLLDCDDEICFSVLFRGWVRSMN